MQKWWEQIAKPTSSDLSARVHAALPERKSSFQMRAGALIMVVLAIIVAIMTGFLLAAPPTWPVLQALQWISTTLFHIWFVKERAHPLFTETLAWLSLLAMFLGGFGLKRMTKQNKGDTDQ